MSKNKKKLDDSEVLIEKPDIPALESTQKINSSGELEKIKEDVESYYNLNIVNCNISVIKGMAIESSYVRSSTVSQSVIERFDVIDVQFRGCNFTNVQWKYSNFSRVEFIACKFTGANFVSNDFKNCSFIDCQCELVQLNSSKCMKVRFENCMMKDILFFDSQLRSTLISKCIAHGMTLSNTDYNLLNICGSEIDGLQVNFEIFCQSNVTLDLIQAAYLLEHFTSLKVV